MSQKSRPVIYKSSMFSLSSIYTNTRITFKPNLFYIDLGQIQ